LKKSRLLGAVCACVSLLWIVNPASGAIIDNGLTTLDSDTGYEWLDITETTNCTYAVLLSGGICNGTDLSVWTLASLTDVYEFWNNAGITVENSETYTVPNTTEIIDLIGLVGTTNTNTSTFYGTNGYVSDSVDMATQLYVQDGTSRDYSFVGHPTSPVMGGWLYRTAEVPIPAAVWLFGTGLLGLIGVARRKKVA